MRPVLALALLLAAASLPDEARARAFDSQLPFEVTAREIEWDGQLRLMVAEGQVRLVQQKNSLEADWVAFNQATGTGVASGDVVLIEGDETVEAALVEFVVDGMRGFVLQGRYDTGPDGFIVRSSELIRTGDDTYSVADGGFTTCRCPDKDARKPWEIQAEETDMEVGGYAYSKNAKLAVLGIPVIWLPRMIFPVKTERESGVLFPELDIGSRNGVDVGLPIFWAAREDLNLTFTPRYLSKRGVKGDVEAEAVYGKRSYSDLFSAYVREFGIDENSAETPYKKNRWAVKYRHDQDLPGDVHLQGDVRLISDNEYVVDFDEMRRHRIDRYLQTTAYASRAFAGDDRIAAVGAIFFADDLQNGDINLANGQKIRDRDRYMLNRLPDMSVSALTGSLGPLKLLVGSMDSDYTYFDYRHDPLRELGFTSDSPEVIGKNRFVDIGINALPDIFAFGQGDGRFEEGEPLGDRGHRVSLYPRLGMPLRLSDRFDLYPEVGYQQMLYDSDAQGFAQRGMLTARVDLATRLRGSVQLPWLPDLEHVVEPRLAWAFVDPSSQGGNPLYIPGTAVPQTRIRQLSHELVVTDDADRVERSNRLRLSVSNSFYRPKQKGGPARLWGEVTLSTEYDFAQDRWGSVILDGYTYPWKGPNTRFVFGYDLDETRIDEALLDMWTVLPRDITLGIRYRYLRRIPRFAEAFRSQADFDEFRADFMRVNQFGVGLRVPLISRFTLTYALSYSFELDIMIGNQGGLEYRSKCKCWAVGIDVSQDRVRGVEVGFRYTLLGIGDDRLGRTATGRGGLSGLF